MNNTQTNQYKHILRQLPAKQKATAKYYNNGQGYFAIVYRSKFIGWATPKILKALIKKDLVKLGGLYE